MSKKKVIIVGGGFGGIAAAKLFRGRKDVDVLLIDKRNHHVFQPLLYQVATSSLTPSDIAYPLRSTFKNAKNVRVILGNVTKIDREKKFVSLKAGMTYEFDYLIIAAGARHSYFGNDEWGKYAFGLKTVKDALVIRERMLFSFERAERAENAEERNKHLTFVVVGGGPTGVEMAGAIAEIARQTMIKDFRQINPKDARIILVEFASRLLQVYPESLSERARRDLEKMGVTVWLNKAVTNVEKDLIHFGEESMKTSNIIWAAGNQASPLIKEATESVNRVGQAVVNDDYTVKESDSIFCIGDCAEMTDANGVRVPGVAPAAAQAGRYVAKLIIGEINGKIRTPFKYLDKGAMATIGKARAVASVGPFKFTGLFAWLMWSLVHVWYLIDFRAKIFVMSSWMWNFLTHQRSVRLIVTLRDREMQ